MLYIYKISYIYIIDFKCYLRFCIICNETCNFIILFKYKMKHIFASGQINMNIYCVVIANAFSIQIII